MASDVKEAFAPVDTDVIESNARFNIEARRRRHVRLTYTYEVENPDGKTEEVLDRDATVRKGEA